MAVISSVYQISDIRHLLFPIEYPDSSDDGIAYVFHVKNWSDKKAVFNDVNEVLFLFPNYSQINANCFFLSFFCKIQYSLGPPGGGHSNTFCPFLGVKCKDEKKTCQGVKLCTIAAPEIKNATHSAVNPEVDLSSSKNPSFLTLSYLHQVRLNTQE